MTSNRLLVKALQESQRLIDQSHIYLAEIKKCRGMYLCECELAKQWRSNQKLINSMNAKLKNSGAQEVTNG